MTSKASVSPDKLCHSFCLLSEKMEPFVLQGALCSRIMWDQCSPPHCLFLHVTGSSVSQVITLTLIFFLFLTMSRTSKPTFFYCLKNVQANLYRLLFLFQLFYFSEGAIPEMDSDVCWFFLSL